MKQELTSFLRKGDKPQFVEHHQVVFTDLSHEFGEAKVFLGREEIIYLSTLRKQGAHLLSALEHTLAGHPLFPAF